MPRKTASFVRKEPVQARARATVDAILQAAAHILVRDGHDALTTNRVAERAGVSIGSLYQYFPNKEALVAALSKKHLDDIEATIEAALAASGRGLAFPDLVRSLIEANIAAHMIDPALHGALSDHLPDQGAADWRIAFETRVAAKVKALLQAHRKGLAVTDLDLATYVVVRSVEACVHDAWRLRRADLKSGALARDVTRLVIAYLTGDPPSPPRGRG